MSGLPAQDADPLRERLAALSPAQRSALLQRLGLKPEPAPASAPSPKPAGLPCASPLRVVPAPTPHDPARTVREFLADPGLLPLWFLHQFAEGAAVYNSPFAFRLHGPLDVTALARAFDALVARHEPLRSTFALTPDGALLLRIASSADPVLALTDFSHLPGEAGEHAAADALGALARTPLDSEEGPLIRVQLFRLGPEHHVLGLVVHHLVYDGWSRANLYRDLAALYADAAVNLPPLPAYADYTAWRQERLASPAAAAARTFWHERLAGVESVPTILPDVPADGAAPFVGAVVRARLEPALWIALRDRARIEGTTLFAVVFTAYVALLRRHAGAEEVCVGVPTAGRIRPEIEGSVGCFIRMLALRVALPGDPSLRALLAEAGRGAAATADHQEITPEYFPELSGGRGAVYQTLFALQNFPRGDFALSGIAVTPVPIHSGTSKVDLAFTLEPDTDPGAGAGVSIEYNPGRFSPERIGRFLDEWLDTLRQLATDPAVTLSCVPCVVAERRRLLVEWNQTAVDYPRDRCIHELFEEHAVRRPDAIAVKFGDTTLTYAQLAQRVDAFALRLRSLGVGPAESPVGVYLDRSPDLVVTLLAILKAGGLYVPLSKDYPAERLRFMLADSRAALVVADAPLPPTLEFTGTWLNSADTALASPAVTKMPIADVFPANRLAYVIYTSGSTGTPKGVAVSHRAVVRLVRGQAYADFSPDDRFLLLAPTSFDASTFELWGPLLNGARCVIAPDGPIEFDALEKLVREAGITCLWLTAGLFNHIADLQPSLFGALRHVITGGEALSVVHVHRVMTRWPQLRLTNGYGPTECTTFALTHRIRADASFLNGSIPIGRPIANTTAFVLNANLQPVPVGVSGELFLGGDGLARGYLDQPALTAEKFIPHPFSTEPGARLYRTGDHCRYRHDGNIEFLGRLDHQVKIRGFRIELGEIEAVLAELPGIAQSVVLAREDTPGEKRLVAYVVPMPDVVPAPTAALMREQLNQRLPDYLVPSAFVVIPQLPLTTNGKVDHKALPSPEFLSAPAIAVCIAPRTPTEEIIAGVWAAVLRLPRVGIHDNFFHLGGHSLLATQVVARLRPLLSLELPIKLLFENPTVAGLAGHISGLAATAMLPPLLPAPRDQPLELSFTQQRLWFLDRFENGSTEYHILSGLRLRGVVDIAALRRSFQALVDRHESLRTCFPEMADRPVQQISHRLAVELPFTDLSALAPAERESALAAAQHAERTTPFDLAAGPLFRTRLLRIDADEHALLFTVHHIVSDGWSQEVIERELTALYRAFSQGQPDPLPPLSRQYADYAWWQRAWLQAAELERQLAYWRRHLDSPVVLELPTDLPRPAILSHAGARVQFMLPPALTARLAAFGHTESVTPFMSLLAVFQALLARCSGQDDIWIGTPIANRRLDEVENVVGFFANTLVLRTDLSGSPSFRELVARTRTTALQAYAHQDLPFEQLVAALNPSRDLGRHPLFQVSFALQNIPAPSLVFPGLTCEALPEETSSTHFDLELKFVPHGDAWSGSLSYRTDLFLPATIERMAGHFVTLLENLLHDPNRAVEHVELLTAAERRQLLVDWNRNAADYPRDLCLHQLFEAQVARTPHLIAVTFEGASLTYAQLNQRANQLAHRLRSHGVGVNDLVGICQERSLALIIGLYAIVKSGGAYVPLDPHYPADRLKLMIEDARPKVILGQAVHLRDVAPRNHPLIEIDGCDEPAPPEWTANPAHLGSPQDLAYMIYTSGSTGRPKGALNRHAGIVNRLCWMQERFALTPDDTVLQKTPSSFDVSVWEFFWPLLFGAKIEMATPQAHKDPAYLARILRERNITVLHFVPPMLRVLLSVTEPRDWAGVRCVVCSGEALGRDVQDEFFRQSSARLENLYGPTEAAVDVSHWACDPASPLPFVPIGRPVANTRLYILDTRRLPVPIGVPGELHIGGVQVGCGYLNQPALTADRFIPDPFSPEPDARLYRTGDRCRYLPDGNIEFLGRLDHQVKIRGFRIEPGEIEAALAEHSGVVACAVIAREEPSGDQRLVAYVVPSPGASAPSGESLREHLGARLPEHFVPGTFVLLTALPLTPNGKVDRKALPSPEVGTGAVHGGTADDEPRPGLEQELASVWAEALGHPVGREENFFACGGHSLLAARISSALLRRTGRRLPIAVFFTAPTVAKMAAWLLNAPDAPPSRSLVSLQPHGVAPALFCVHGWGGYAYGYLHLAKALAPHRPVHGIQALGLDGRSPRHTTVEEMATHYVDEIRAHQPEGPYHIIGFSAGGWMAYAVAQELRRQGARVGLLVMLDSSGNARLPIALRFLEAARQSCNRAIFLWHDRRAFWRRLTARPGFGLPFLIRRLQQWFFPKPIALPQAGDELAPPPLRREAGEPAPSADYFHAVVTAYRAKRYNGDAVIFSSRSTGSYRWSFWHLLVSGKVTVLPARGEHLELLDAENVPSLAAALRPLLAQADKSASP